MTRRQINKTLLALIEQELGRAIEVWPQWPGNPILASAIVIEEAGELLKAANDYSNSIKFERRYEKFDKTAQIIKYTSMREEAVQTAAMAIRFLMETCEVGT